MLSLCFLAHMWSPVGLVTDELSLNYYRICITDLQVEYRLCKWLHQIGFWPYMYTLPHLRVLSNLSEEESYPSVHRISSDASVRLLPEISQHD